MSVLMLTAGFYLGAGYAGSTTCAAESASTVGGSSGGSGASRRPASIKSSPNVPLLLQTGTRLTNMALHIDCAGREENIAFCRRRKGLDDLFI